MAPPANDNFKQQTLRAWRPVLTPRLIVVLFATGGCIFIPIGVLILLFSNEVVEVVGDDYSGQCCVSNCSSSVPWQRVDSNPCRVTITVTQRMEPPVFVYYKLTDYYQNHRRYQRSRDDNQLRGKDVPESSLLLPASCLYHVLAGPSGNPDNVISPCGLMAWSVFNDSFALFDSRGSEIPLNEKGIAWPSDLAYKFKNAPNGTTGLNFPPFHHWRSRTCAELPTIEARTACAESPASPQAGWCFPGSGYCTEDEHFVIWMRAAGLPNFRKLYARIETAVEAGTYTIQVSSGVVDEASGAYMNTLTGERQPFLYPTASFGGTKAIVLSTTTWMGGRNFFLGYAYVIVGVICMVLAICFMIKYRMSPRDLGDASYITWNKETTPS